MSKWARFASVLFIAALSVSCDAGFGPGLESPLAPETQVDGLRLFDERTGAAQATPLIVDEDQLTFLEETLPAGAPVLDIKYLGLGGGLFGVAGHGVQVPLGAVTSLTRFSMERLPGSRIAIELHANRGVLGWLGSTVVDLFEVPVKLEMSYAGATNAPSDPSRIVIVRYRDDGTYEIMPTTVDPATKKAWTKLDHFSLYAMASN